MVGSQLSFHESKCLTVNTVTDSMLVLHDLNSVGALHHVLFPFYFFFLLLLLQCEICRKYCKMCGIVVLVYLFVEVLSFIEKPWLYSIIQLCSIVVKITVKIK